MGKGSIKHRHRQLDETTLFRSSEKLPGLIPDAERGVGNEFGMRVISSRLCDSEYRNEITIGDYFPS